MRESIVVIYPTAQGESRAALCTTGKSGMGGMRGCPSGADRSMSSQNFARLHDRAMVVFRA
jgi:hypothetical protein